MSIFAAWFALALEFDVEEVETWGDLAVYRALVQPVGHLRGQQGDTWVRPTQVRQAGSLASG